MPVERTPPRERHVPEETAIYDKEDLNCAPNMSKLRNASEFAGTKDVDQSVEVTGDGFLSSLQDKEVSEAFHRRNVGRLDDSVFQLFGPSSRHNSEDGSSTDKEALCVGGPGKKTCNEQVKDGQQAVQCDKCLSWYHAACQKVTKPALSALRKFEDIGVCWLCNHCKPNISTVAGNDQKGCEAKMETLSKKMSSIEASLQHHMELMERALKEQEKNIADQTKLIEKSIKTEHEQKQTSFAEIVKQSCNNLTKEVTTKLDSVTQGNASRGNMGQNRNEVAGILDSFLDKEQRKMNLVIHNMEEPSAEGARERASKDAENFKVMIRETMKIVVHTTKCFRVGRRREERPRLLIVSVDDLDTKHEILRHARDLRGIDNYGNIFITPDLTKSEREQGKKTRDELARRREAGEKDLVIWRGKIIKKNTQAHDARIPQAAVDQGRPAPNVQQEDTIHEARKVTEPPHDPESDGGKGRNQDGGQTVRGPTGIFTDIQHSDGSFGGARPRTQVTPPSDQH